KAPVSTEVEHRIVWCVEGSDSPLTVEDLGVANGSGLAFPHMPVSFKVGCLVVFHFPAQHVGEVRVVRVVQVLNNRVGPWVDVFYNGDDLGLQDGPMIRREWFTNLLAPRYIQYHEAIKAKVPQAKIFFHTCGSVVDLLPDIIETGIDILNPVQVNAAGMGDTAMLKREFGDEVTFWGAVDTQHVMPNGGPEDVRDEVRRRIDDLAPGGGYVLNTSHNIQADVPPENILALVEALDEFGWY
ncbi:MAG: uroporphyrinogen decarboxylase family protein, partial [Myxococcota bacterium]